jgi:hypothetical protein
MIVQVVTLYCISLGKYKHLGGYLQLSPKTSSKKIQTNSATKLVFLCKS